MILENKIDIKYSSFLCYELGLNYFKIRTTFIKDNKEFQKLYSKCIDNAINRYNFERNDRYINELEILNTSNETTLKDSLEYIWAGSYSIIKYDSGTFIVIAYSWHHYLLIEPIKSIANEYINEELYNYIRNNYKNEKLSIIQYRNISSILSTNITKVLNT
jgi:hypothetical protein